MDVILYRLLYLRYFLNRGFNLYLVRPRNFLLWSSPLRELLLSRIQYFLNIIHSLLWLLAHFTRIIFLFVDKSTLLAIPAAYRSYLNNLVHLIFMLLLNSLPWQIFNVELWVSLLVRVNNVNVGTISESFDAVFIVGGFYYLPGLVTEFNVSYFAEVHPGEELASNSILVPVCKGVAVA